MTFRCSLLTVLITAFSLIGSVVFGQTTKTTPAAKTKVPQSEVIQSKIAQPEITESKAAKPKVVWHDAKQLGIEGQAWNDTVEPYDRLPGRAKEHVRPAVWNLSRQSAGLCVRFLTNATTIHARWKLRSAKLAMPHMPATGVSGLDLYAKDTDDRWRWVTCGFPSGKENEIQLVSGLADGQREYMLYLPLYNGVTDVSIGVPPNNQFTKAPARPEDHKPIVFYGTSITQGGCASRPGMVHTAILGRQLNRPVINLGFSGNGEMESAVGTLMAEIDASVFVIDCLPNMVVQEVTERTVPLVAILRKSHPHTPIVLVEDRNYSNSWILKGKQSRNQANQAALKAAFEQLRPTDSQLYYIDAAGLLGTDNEGTVDSSHPTDLGFMRQAHAFLKVIGPLVDGGIE